MNMFIYRMRKEDHVRRKDDTLRDTVLKVARSIADTDGIDAVNIRTIAQRAGIATGTMYNYFSNKDEILLALTEEYWMQTLLEMRTVITADSFCGQLEEIFIFLRERIDQSAGKLMNSLGGLEALGQTRMASMQGVLEAALLQCMEQDAKIRGDIWNEQFSKQQFARFVMGNMTMLLKAKAPMPDLYFFISIVKRTLY